MEALVPVAALLHQPVVPAHLAVVARQDHERARRQSLRVQVGEQPAELVVNLALSTVVGGPQLPAFALVVRRGADEQVVEGMERRLFVGADEARERAHLVG